MILLLSDLTAPLRPEATQLCAAFGLTVAEAKLAAKLASGSGIVGAAASLGVSRETARTQLKAVFAKTNTRRQAELAALVSRLRSYDSYDRFTGFRRTTPSSNVRLTSTLAGRGAQGGDISRGPAKRVEIDPER